MTNDLNNMKFRLIKFNNPWCYCWTRRTDLVLTLGTKVNIKVLYLENEILQMKYYRKFELLKDLISRKTATYGI